VPRSIEKAELLQGTLDMLILQSLVRGPQHGYSIARWIHAASRELLQIEEGSLYPALHRMERRGWISSEWGQSESNRRAKFYQLTRIGRSQLGSEVHAWRQLVSAITLVLQATAGEAAT
jgi:PadR family transcriptional regulator, regulatory protein PadR